MADELKIRDFREEDAPALARMWQESLPVWPPFFNDGIPYTAKDGYLVRGLTAAAGSPAFAGLVAQRDAFTIERLRAGRSR